MGLNPGCGPGLVATPAARSPFPGGAECPRHRAVAVGGPPRGRPSRRRGGDRPAWEAVGTEGRLLAAEPVFSLKFMPFCRSVLSLIAVLPFQGSPFPVTSGKGGRRGRVKPGCPALGRKREKTCDVYFLRAPPTSGPRPPASGAVALWPSEGYLSTWRWLLACCWADVSVLPSLAVGSRPGGWRARAPWAASRTPIPTGSRRSGSCRRWRGTGSLLGPRPEAGLRAPALQAAPLGAGRPAAAPAARGPCFLAVVRGAGAGVRVPSPVTCFIPRLESSACLRAVAVQVLGFWGGAASRSKSRGLGAP